MILTLSFTRSHAITYANSQSCNPKPPSWYFLVAARLGQFQKLPKTQVILILIFTRPHAITYANNQKSLFSFLLPYNGERKVGAQKSVLKKRQEFFLLFHGDLFLQFKLCVFLLVLCSQHESFHLLTFRRCSQLVLYIHYTWPQIFSFSHFQSGNRSQRLVFRWRSCCLRSHRCQT